MAQSLVAAHVEDRAASINPSAPGADADRFADPTRAAADQRPERGLGLERTALAVPIAGVAAVLTRDVGEVLEVGVEDRRANGEPAVLELDVAARPLEQLLAADLDQAVAGGEGLGDNRRREKAQRDSDRNADQKRPPRPRVTSPPEGSCPDSMFMKALESTPITEVMRLGPVPGLKAS
jgi:hypothetical protein